MLQGDCNLETLYLVKKPNARVPTVWVQFYEMFRVGKSMETECSAGCQELRARERGEQVRHGSGSPVWVRKRLWNQVKAVAAQYCECPKCYSTH